MAGMKKTVAAIGNFDGVHLGHQHLLRATAGFAAQLDARLGVVLFDPHPRRYFRPDEPPFLLTTPEQRDALLRAADVDDILVLKFDETLASTPPDAFVRDVLKGRLGLGGIVAGADFRFGKGRAGDGAMMKALGAELGLGVKLVDLLDAGGAKFGSSAIREALRAGDVDKAAAMLGRPWSVSGAVNEGRRVGRTIGFPTANMTLGELVAPRQGVYATRVSVDGETYDAVSNFGRRPTVGESAPLLESHLFDFSGELYGREIEVAFIAFLRDERKFDGLDALKAQIAADCERARALLN